MFRSISEYVKNVIAEMKAVSWPTAETVKYSSIVVVSISLIFAAYIFIVDYVLTLLIGRFLQ